MLAARTPLPHFLVSSASSLPKSAGEPGSTIVPTSANDALILGSARAALTSELSLATISTGVFFGAAKPYQPLASYPGTKSPSGGVSGNTFNTVAGVTAKRPKLPD